MINSTEHDVCRICSLDPRSKIITAFLVILVILAIPFGSFLKFLLVFNWLTIIFLFSHHSIGYYIKRILAIYPMVFFMTFLLPFRNPGTNSQIDIWYKIGTLSIYYQGIQSFLDVNIRSILIYSTSLIFINETSVRGILKTLTSLHMPKWIEAIVIYMQRFMLIISSEFTRMHLAFSARSFGMNWPRKSLSVAKMSGVYFSRLIDRSERLHQAMIARGFNGEIYTRFKLKWKTMDTVFLFTNLLFFCLLLSEWII